MYSQNVPQDLIQPVIDVAVHQDPNISFRMYQNED
ncbi:hypothetical protein O9929_22365 [Vibrio lentus]|nr:hypothetical protein [Vibrio lentus]